MVGIAVIMIHEYTATAKEAGYRAGEEACIAQAAKDNADAVERLKKRVSSQHDINLRAHQRADAAHKALAEERAAHAQTRANQCNADCRVHIPESSQ